MNPIGSYVPAGNRDLQPCVEHQVVNCMPCWQAQIAAVRKADYALIEAANRRDRIQWLIERSGIPARYAGATFADLDSAKRARMDGFLERARAGVTVSMVVLGNVGTGKTHSSCALIREACERGMHAKYTRTFDIARQVKDTWGEKGATEERALEAFLSPTVLVIDEIGLGTPDEKDAERLHALIDDRYMAGKPTVFVTNLSTEELKAQFGLRLYDRMRDGVIGVQFSGESRRAAS